LAGKIKQQLLRFNTLRRIVQLFAFIFFSAVLFNLGALPLLLPVMWTWGLNPNTAGDAFTAIQFLLGGWNLTNSIFPWLAIASFLVVGILIGKSMCGWICPFGFIQDLVGYIKRKQTEFSPRTHESIIYAKYFILGTTLFISITYSVAKLVGVGESYGKALGIFAYAPFSTLSPAETLFGMITHKVLDFSNAVVANQVDILSGIAGLPTLFWVQLFIMGAVLVLAAYVPRSWCKYFCPHGAIMAILNRFSFLGLRRDLVKCAKAECRQCVEVCPMRVPILELPWEKFSDPECIYCLKCVDACPNKAIRVKYP